MKNKFTPLKACLTLLFAVIISSAFAQTPFTGPSDAVTAPPGSAAAVSQVICSSGQIQLKTTPTAGYTYQWYKKKTDGTMQLVQDGSSSTYTETPTGPGYYTYQLVQINSTGCTSASSDPFNVFVLPPITAGITASSSNVCASGQTSATLSATPVNGSGYTYTYQWTRNGVDIPGATSSTYTVNESTAGSVTFGVTVAYTLNSSCSSSTTTTITVVPVPTKPVIVTGP
ncbi:hypothetical protein BEL04_13800 [Mucilaginibacter sp. PPCGB 2223]|uniref:Ig-like domain-containing protein n=1 Tax=Mucilaginibacter sp. PPCGB 2223 TaxID=1886027 RepID=UPI0008246CD9|nr:hypothetical protein [Mucilaginibacter sp. PPCGB 2223]OCX52527.1 hypothetical protein BEL04_13800 [Mucilaginibacter sp. PPCGB 2223]